MNSTERAPEPTMEEILASIRRIISDDEANSNQPQATSSDYAGPVAVEDTDDGAADTQMIDDIARVLSSAAPSSAESEEDILDLDLAEPEELVLEAPLDAEMIVTEEVILTEVYGEMEPETKAYAEAPPAPDFTAAFPPAPESEAAEGFAGEDQPLAEPSVEEPIMAEAPESAEMFTAEEIGVEVPATEEVAMEMPPPVRAELPPAPEIPSLDDSTTALERAIAALKAGDLAAFAREAQSGYAEPAAAVPTPPEAEMPLAATEPELEPEAEPETEALALEEELILSEQAAEPSPEEWSEESTSWPEPEMELAPESEPDAAAEAAIEAEIEEEQAWSAAEPEAPEAELEPEPTYESNANHVNGGTAHKSHGYETPMAAKSLEDSVKEMLRPMLREWLKENMPRVLNVTLREELNNLERRGD
jgi:cell pole-organizing protein PopZ